MEALDSRCSRLDLFEEFILCGLLLSSVSLKYWKKEKYIPYKVSLTKSTLGCNKHASLKCIGPGLGMPYLMHNLRVMGWLMNVGRAIYGDI